MREWRLSKVVKRFKYRCSPHSRGLGTRPPGVIPPGTTRVVARLRQVIARRSRVASEDVRATAVVAQFALPCIVFC